MSKDNGGFRGRKDYRYADNTGGLMFGLTAEEMARVGQEGAMEARRRAFAAGRSVTYESDGEVVREYADGRREIIATY